MVMVAASRLPSWTQVPPGFCQIQEVVCAKGIDGGLAELSLHSAIVTNYSDVWASPLLCEREAVEAPELRGAVSFRSQGRTGLASFPAPSKLSLRPKAQLLQDWARGPGGSPVSTQCVGLGNSTACQRGMGQGPCEDGGDGK